MSHVEVQLLFKEGELVHAFVHDSVLCRALAKAADLDVRREPFRAQMDIEIKVLLHDRVELFADFIFRKVDTIDILVPEFPEHEAEPFQLLILVHDSSDVHGLRERRIPKHLAYPSDHVHDVQMRMTNLIRNVLRVDLENLIEVWINTSMDVFSKNILESPICSLQVYLEVV